MSSALEAAAGGLGAVEPNPMVGAVIVRDGVEIASGFHRRFGGPHAEVEAIASAAQAGADIRGATMYVTLEPCCHQGKTPPCTQAVIGSRIARVVVAMEDPDSQVAGRGIDELRAAGVEVVVGVLGGEARQLLAPYVKLRTEARPWVICKWAQTSDGYLALPAAMGRWVSGESSRRRVQQLRSRCDGILVGAGTVLADDPLLTNRSGAGRRPGRVVLDSTLRIGVRSKLALTAREVPLLIATTARAAADKPDKARGLVDTGAELLALPASSQGVDLGPLLDELGRRRWTHLLVEGGPGVLRSFVYGRLADELMVFVSPRQAAEAGAVGDLPHFDVFDVLRDIPTGEVHRDSIGQDELLTVRLARPGEH